MRRRLALCLLASLPLATAPAAPTTEDGNTWPQWRGPHRDGHFDGRTWPDELSTQRLEKRWRVKLGPSYAGPIVTADRVFTTETREEKYEAVYAYERASGEQLWQVEWEGSMEVPFFAARNGSWIRSTPAFDGEALYVAGMRDVLVCIEADRGEVRWKVDFCERHDTPLPTFGFVCSPLVLEDGVVVQAAASLVKVDRDTGETIWRSLTDGGGMMGSAFSSPVLAEIQGVEQLLVQTRTYLAGVDPDSGEKLWSRPIKADRGMNILTPMPVDDQIFTAAYGGKCQLLNVGHEGDAYHVSEEWDNRLQAYMTSPVVLEGDLYFFTRSNRFACLSLLDGETNWVSGPTGDSYWSLVAQLDRILALSDNGILRLIAASPEGYEVLGEAQVSEAATWAHLAVAGEELFIREQDGLVVYHWE